MTNRNSRAKILNAVRLSLGKTHSMEQSTHKPHASVPKVGMSTFNQNNSRVNNLTEQFITEAIANQCTVTQINSEDHIPKAVKEYIDSQKLPHKIYGWQQFKTLNWAQANIEFIDQYIDKNTPVEGTIGLTGTTYAIADTGTLLMQSHPQTPLQTSLLPESHIAIVYQQQIYATLPEILSNQLINSEENSQTVLISGPSRTADIEQTLVLGAHGPKYVHLIVVQEED